MKNFTEESFINNNSDTMVSNESTFNLSTLRITDLLMLEEQIDRATKLALRTKNRSSIIRMALKALSQTPDDLYITLHRE